MIRNWREILIAASVGIAIASMSKLPLPAFSQGENSPQKSAVTSATATPAPSLTPTKPKSSSSATSTASTTTTPSGKRLKLTVTITDPSDLKIRQGSTVQAGDIIADRTKERDRLLAQQQQLKLSLDKIKATPILAPPPPRKVPPVANLPGVSYEQAKSEIDKAQLEVTARREDLALQQRKTDAITLLPEEQSASAIVQHEQAVSDRLERDLSDAESNLALVKSKLESAKESRNYDVYKASLETARRIEEANQIQLAYNRQLQESQSQKREQDYQLAQIQAKLGDIDMQLGQLATVRSPFSGTIRRVKFLSQTNGELNVEIILIASQE